MTRGGVEALTGRLLGSPEHGPRIVASRISEAGPGARVPFPPGLDPRLVRSLAERTVERLWAHQREAIEAALSGQDLLVVGPTASGKSLCYDLPVLQGLLADPAARALYLFPTKALARDQCAAIGRLVSGAGGGVGVQSFDGDTPRGARRTIRQSARLLLTNPDMLHAGILPQHSRWAGFLRGLRYVVLDELHVYRGLFGSHLANLVRRLERLVRFHSPGASLQYLCASATLGNPLELARRLTGREMTLVEREGPPSGRRHFLFYRPDRQTGHLEAARQLTSLAIEAGHQTILFAPSRQAVELLTHALQQQHDDVAAYRGGYLASERREIEHALREGSLRAVVATSALELGIDIGGLDVAILAGYPGSVAATWQRAGRAGRAGAEALAVLVGRQDPLDRYLLDHPDYFFGRGPERALVDPDNLAIRVGHLQCAAFELPVDATEALVGPETGEILDYLAERGALHRAGGRYHWRRDRYPASEFSLRSIPGSEFLVRLAEEERVLSRVAEADAARTIHPEAVLLVRGEPYRIQALDWERREAWAERGPADHYTEPVTRSELRVLRAFERCGPLLARGEVEVCERVVAFRRRALRTGEALGQVELSLPETLLSTRACWWEVAGGREATGGLAYLLHHLGAGAVMCDVGDLGRVVTGGALYLYDRHPGGIGLADALFAQADALLARAGEVVDSCDCEDGCPACVGPGRDRAAVRALLAGGVAR